MDVQLAPLVVRLSAPNSKDQVNTYHISAGAMMLCVQWFRVDGIEAILDARHGWLNCSLV